ncbi:MAG: O-antigen ligase family protein [Syntrophorhabdales bacterium]
MGKIGLFFALVISVMSEAIARHKFSFPKGLLGLAGPGILLFACLGGIVQSDVSLSFQRIKDVLLCFIMLWTAFMYSRMGGDVSKVFFAAALIIAAHCFLVVSSKVIGFPDWRGPQEFSAFPLWVSGFTGLRTGWSNGTALFVPILGAIAFEPNKRSLPTRAVSLLALVSIVGSQVVVGGKAGMLASLLGLLLLLSFRGMRRYLPLYVAACAVVGICLAGYMYDQMRIDQAAQYRQSIGKIDRFSAGRVLNDIKGIQMGLERPIAGYGFDGGSAGPLAVVGTTGNQRGAIHNLWIRLFVESGIFPPVIFTLIAIIIYRHSKKVSIRYVYHSDPAQTGNGAVTVGYYGRIIILTGLVIANLEPAFLFGAFQASSAWWAVAGACASMSTFTAKRSLTSLASRESVDLRGGSDEVGAGEPS